MTQASEETLTLRIDAAVLSLVRTILENERGEKVTIPEVTEAVTKAVKELAAW